METAGVDGVAVLGVGVVGFISDFNEFFILLNANLTDHLIYS